MSQLAIFGGEQSVNNLVSWPVCDRSDEVALLETFKSGKWFRYDGVKNEQFERLYAEYCGVRFGLTVTNGTAAIEIPLVVSGIGPGDEVIVPSYTFFSTASAVSFVGATPVFCDIDPDTYNMDLDHLESLVNPRTRAIIPVHFAGFPVDMERINVLAGKYSLMVIEDCAHAHGAKYKGKMLGAWSDASTFSFQASKNLCSGEGGLILTDHEDLYGKMFSRHTCGRKLDGPWYMHHTIGSNLRLTELQAALLLTQFQRLDTQFQERAVNARRIEKAIDDIDGLKRVQTSAAFSQDRAYHLLMFRYDPGFEGVSRQTLIDALVAEGVPASSGYPFPLYRQPAFETIVPPVGQGPYKELYLPQVEQCCHDTVWIIQNALLGPEINGSQISKALYKIADNAEALRNYECSKQIPKHHVKTEKSLNQV